MPEKLEIEVTQEMISAGASVIESFYDIADLGQLAERVFVEMMRVHLRNAQNREDPTVC